MAEGTIALRLISPDRGELKIDCDSVRFSLPDSKDGKIPGGSVGIRRGHTDALMAVAPGTVLAFSGGKKIFSCEVGAGFAVVSKEGVSILTERFYKETAD